MLSPTRVFFLGAGASVDAGVPMAGELLTKIRKTDPYQRRQYKFYKQPSDRAFLKIAIESVLRSRNWVRAVGLNTFNVERLLSMGEMASRLGLGIPYEGGKLVEARWFVDVLMSWILEIIEQSMKEKLPKCYQRFSDYLRPTDTLVTLNYDLVCETYLRNGSKGAEYHIVGSGSHNSSGCFGSSIDLLKLHGSVNWRRCVQTSEEKSCGNVFIHEDHDIPVPGYGSARVCECGRGVLRSFVVAPTPLKDYEDAALMLIWKLAVKKLLSATDIYIIGYSMPAYDMGVRNLLGLVSVNNKNATFHIVNPDGKCDRAFAFLPETRRRMVRSDFRSFVTNETL